ncbi:phage antirepressor KilAC domain-containing protein [Nonomuraea sp. NPDC050227]|uniref:phage antirepressor KilAC domain-containing protein n=1 Tax=Nonomuraea sp. NPDC050227 TaxID=3364360 RepID=UPI0037A89259
MSEIQLFDNGEFELRIVPDGDSFKVQAPGLARSLGFNEARDMLRTVPEDEKGSEIAPTLGGNQQVWHVSEAGFYRVMGQRQAARIKNDAIRKQVTRFQKWVFGDVLPRLRRGELVAQTRTPIPEDYAAALRRLADEVDARAIAEKQRDELLPLAEAWSDLMEADGTFDWAAVAQIFARITGGLGRNNFLDLLRSDDLKILKANNTPYQFKGMDRFFKVIPTKAGRDATPTTRVTADGLDWLRKRLIKHFNHQSTLFAIGEIA